MTASSVVRARVPPELGARLEQLAADDCLTASGYLAQVLAVHARTAPHRRLPGVGGALSEVVRARVSVEVRTRLEALAADDCLTLSGYVAQVLAQHVREVDGQRAPARDPSDGPVLVETRRG